MQGTDQSQREPPIVFVHIPKTAGTTLRAVLQNNYGRGEVRTFGNVFKGRGGARPQKIRKLPAAFERVGRDATVLYGHFPFGLREHLPPDARYITMLRDPVERTMSQYHNVRRDFSKAIATPVAKDAGLQEVLARGEAVVDNLQTRMLSDAVDPASPVTEEMLEQAKENVGDKFFAFGVTERFDESLVLIARRLGLSKTRYAPLRVTDHGPGGNEISAAERTLAEQVNEFDLQLYRWAADRFDRIVQDEGMDFQLAVARLRLERLEGLLAQVNGVAHDLREQFDALEAM